jgi:limonene-1,2-epoxide hydrolase
VTTTDGLHSLPVVGVIELRDGVIHAWREYFDSVQASPALTASSPGHPA